MKAPLMLTVDVTEQHIREGQPRDGFSCPLALAIAEKYGDRPFVSSGVEITFDNGKAFYRKTRRSKHFINAFDCSFFKPPPPGRYRFILRKVVSF